MLRRIKHSETFIGKLREMRTWHKSAPRDKPVLVYGRHAQETKIIEKNVPTLRKMGYTVFRVPKKLTVLSDRSSKDRDTYNELLAREFKGRKVVDLHTSPSGFDSYFGLKFKRNVVGLEIPSHELSRAQRFGFKHVVRGAFHRHVVHLSRGTRSRGDLLPKRYPSGKAIPTDVQLAMKKELARLKRTATRGS